MAGESYDIKILKNGTWLYGGTPITRENMVRLFARTLKRDAQGGYWLETPYEKGRIAVEDAPFTAVEVAVESSGKDQILSFRTNLDDRAAAGPGHDLRMNNGAPYLHVRDGLEALVLRPVYYDLVKLAVKQDGVTGVWSCGKFYTLEENISPRMDTNKHENVQYDKKV